MRIKLNIQRFSEGKVVIEAELDIEQLERDVDEAYDIMKNASNKLGETMSNLSIKGADDWQAAVDEASAELHKATATYETLLAKYRENVQLETQRTDLIQQNSQIEQQEVNNLDLLIERVENMANSIRSAISANAEFVRQNGILEPLMNNISETVRRLPGRVLDMYHTYQMYEEEVEQAYEAEEMEEDAIDKITDKYGILYRLIYNVKDAILGIKDATLDMGEGLGQAVKHTAKTNNGFSGIIKKVGRWALALLGIRTVLSILTRSFSTLKQYNSELAEKMEDMQLMLATAFEPVIMWLINMAERLLTIFATLYKTIFGIDLFAASSAKSMGKMAGSAKETKKQLAGFDEMNVLQDNQGGGGGSTHTFNLKPKWDWSDLSIDKIVVWAKELVDKLIKEINKFIKNIDPKKLADGISKLIVGLIDIVNKTFTDINWGELVSKLIQTIMALDWPSIIGGLLENIIITSFIFPIELLLGIIDGILTGILNFIEDPSQWDDAGKKIIDGLWEGIKKCLTKIWDLFKGIIQKFKDIFGIHSPSTVFEDLGTNIIEGLVQGLVAIYEKIKEICTKAINIAKDVLITISTWVYTNIIQPIINYFANLWNNLKEGASNAWNNVKSIFSNLKSFFGNIINNILGFFKEIGQKVGDAVSGAFKGAINGAFSLVENVANTFVRGINNVLSLINGIPGVNIPKLKTVSLPRLAKGGIINQPGKGVMVGNAIAGERGKEGVIPLTDAQQMALLGEAIGKYITINANITNTMNGRVISRELQRIQSDMGFAYNR